MSGIRISIIINSKYLFATLRLCQKLFLFYGNKYNKNIYTEYQILQIQVVLTEDFSSKVVRSKIAEYGLE
jgi:hypothetical protein